MRPIISLELVGNDKLDFNIYDSSGELIYHKGEILTPELLIKLCSSITVFVKKESSTQNANNEGILKHKPIITNQVAETLITISKNIFNKISADEKPNIESCNEATEIIVDEVSNKLGKIDCISQLKIFDEYIFAHTVNVSTMSTALGITLGLYENELKELALGALLHDIGKMLVPKEILKKPAKLTEEEFEIMKSHSLLGYRYILDTINLPDKIAKVALHHQEDYDGGGYPNGLKDTEINFYAQITSVADVYDALTSNRSYKKAVDSDSAVDIMISESINRFNPYIMDKFTRLVDYKNRSGILSVDKEII